MENVRIFTIAELLQRVRSLTATSSISPNSNETSKPSTRSIPIHSNPNPNPNPSHKVLLPLDHLAIIVGTLTLPTAIDASASASSRCPYNTCFQFSDGSASICCDILDFDVLIIRKKISVLAWNFIPWKRGGGFLEIIRWSFQDSNSGLRPCSNFNSIPLGSGSSSGHEDSSRARHGVFGALEVVSPVSTVPCATGHSNLKTNKASDSSHSSSLRGFLLQFMVCECKLCSSKEAVTVLKDSIQEKDAHSFTKPMFVYCSGSVSTWHPVFTKLVGNVVALSGLKKKLVFIGKEESKLMYVTTGNSALHLLRLSWKWRPKCTAVAKGKGECGTYRGIVKGVYMQGMVVELDNEVWLLLTDQLLTPPHSLRAGALVSVRNVHFVNPRFSWTKILILGACFKTSIIVESFSPLETGCHILPQSQSSLGKFVESLTFSARLWVLLIASCFRKKFSGILSEKEILGTKHKGGFVQMYASSQLPSSMHPTRHGVFMELCNHDSCVCGCEPYIGNLNLVVPLSIFICHCEAFWMRAVQLENSCEKLHDDKKYSLQFCEGRSHVQSVRKIFSSEDIGVSLMGSLKTSPSSGRLQLVDATGSIDVLIPDLPSTWDANRIYKVADFSLVIEGMPQSVGCIGLLDNDLFSCRTIFHFIPLARKMNLTVYVYFRLRNSMCRNLPIYPCTGPGEDLKRLESGMFHLLLVTHKFPVLQKYQDDVVIENSSSMFVEAIILPWDLFLAGSYEISCPTRALGDNPKNSMESAGGNYLDHVSPKRRKFNDSSSRGLSSNSVNNSSDSVREPSSCSISYKESREKQKYCDLTSREISCSAMISGVNGHSLVGSVILHCTRAKLNNGGFCRPGGQKVLLEFTSESFYKYQLLHIGCYYITKHDSEDSFCNLKDSSYSSSDNILIPSTTHLWSLSFTSDEICQNNSSLKCLPLDNSLRNDEVLSDHHNEVHLLMSPGNASENSSDISLCLPENVISFGEVILKELEEGLIKPVVTAEGIPKISSCISLAMTAPLLSLDSNSLFPEGNLLSLCGHVISVHSVEDNSVNPYLNCQNIGDPLQRRFLQRAKSSCIHVLVDHHIVRLSGSLSGHAFPVGFGPGVDATFHRVLELRGQNRWMLTSVSFIVINSIRAVSFQNKFIKVDNESCSDKCSSPASYMQNAAPLDLVSSGLISELVKCLDFKPIAFHCRVVAIHILVLEKKFRNVNYQPKNHFRPYLVDIPLAGFVLDDGSSPCCCWANSERAATLLRLYEDFPLSAFESSGWTLKWIRKDDNACSATMYHLERILKNHDRITVKNFGSMFDSSYQDLAVSVSSDNALSSHDENLLKFIIFNACFSKFWTVIGRMMDSNAVTRLKTTNLLETEMSMHSMQHIWAREVHYTNLLTEARNVVQELC
ncbi:CST complex subunit CTC1 isoform X1 [Prunus yedoensis var. nudiflora]|uniref:CST complex subunit CTC1 n=1 Tax=Prunus yedoensis var. nudiflora TaxID=2094558 RepID=A0A314Y351_PRUYE|nr:CST complex subunit CTC1 isoform X1 [Prunus yedoensis var. nudiflora]